MGVADKKRLEQGKSDKPARRERPRLPVQDGPTDDLDPNIKEQLARAKAVRDRAESARQKICSEIMDASKRLYQNLVAEGQQALERAKKLEAAAEFNMLESQRELQRSQSIRQEADSYLQKVITESNKQCQEIAQQSEAIKADAVAFREKLLLEIQQQADLQLDQAQSSRVDADAYRERVIAQTQRQASNTLERSRLTAEQVGNEIKLRYDLEAHDLLAKAELIKAAAEEQLEAQRIYADAASLQSESREVLEQARSMVNQQSPLIGLISRHQSPYQINTQEKLLAAYHQPQSYPAIRASEAGNFSAGVIREFSQSDPLPELGPGPVGKKDSPDSTCNYSPSGDLNSADPAPSVLASADPALGDPVPGDPAPGDPASGETGDPVKTGRTGLKAKETPVTPTANPGTGGPLPANELVLGIESKHQSRAYPFSTITHQKIINDSVGELDILLAFGPPSDLAMMFDRNLDGRSLTFKTVARPRNGIAMMKDRQTGSIWEAATGRAISGPLAGGELKRLTSEYSFWFSWSQAHPTTDVYS